MFKRLFFTAVGLGAGVSLGVYVARKVEATQRRMSPDALAASAGARVDSLAERVRAALAEGRAAAAAKEAELRATYGVRHAHELVAQRGDPAPAADRQQAPDRGSTAPTAT